MPSVQIGRKASRGLHSCCAVSPRTSVYGYWSSFSSTPTAVVVGQKRNAPNIAELPVNRTSDVCCAVVFSGGKHDPRGSASPQSSTIGINVAKYTVHTTLYGIDVTTGPRLLHTNQVVGTPSTANGDEPCTINNPVSRIKTMSNPIETAGVVPNHVNRRTNANSDAWTTETSRIWFA